jgi:hypothetical protein
MTFKDGRIKDGIFENNLFKGAVQVQEGSEVEQQIRNEASPEKRSNSLSRPGQLESIFSTETKDNSRVNPREQKGLIIKTRGPSTSVKR